MKKGNEMDKVEEALLPFAIIGSEMHDTEFTVRIIDVQQNEVGRVTHTDFQKAYDVLLELKSYHPQQEIQPTDPPRDQVTQAVLWIALTWAFLVTAILFIR